MLRSIAALAALVVLIPAAPPPAVGAAPPPPDSSARSAPDTLAAGRLPRVVQMHELLVQSTRLHDPYSSETVYLVPSAVATTLPVDRVSEVLALQPGVIAWGEELHVRGGRSGEARWELRGVDLGDPLDGRPIELPIEALAGADVLTGGIDADEGGSLTGLMRLRTVDPGPTWGGRLEWHTDARTGTHYDRAGARIGGPLGRTGLGVVGSLEARLDDTALPNLRTERRSDVLGGSFGWRADNHLLGDLKLATAPGASRFTFEVAANRGLVQPYDPGWTLDGWTIAGSDLPLDPGPRFSPDSLPGYTRYRAADHRGMTDDRRAVAIAGWERLARESRTAVTLAWLGSRRVTSLDGGDDQAYLAATHDPTYGLSDSHFSDPFHVYQGDLPYYSHAASRRWTLRADHQRASAAGNRLLVGAGMTYDDVALREVDASEPQQGIDSVRAFHAFAPGGWAYAHVRRVFEGLVANGGLRAEYFTVGPQASRQSVPGSGHGIVSLSPRLGVAYPISVRDVFSLAYVRLAQLPPRDLLYDNRTVITNRYPLGNPELAPATAIMYQAAVKHVFDPRWAIQSAVFYRDVYGLPGTVNLQPRLVRAQLQYVDRDEAAASGLETLVMWSGPRGDHFQLGYTWLQARGTESSAGGVPYGPQLTVRPGSIGVHALDWDRRHTFDLAFRVSAAPGSLSWTTVAGSGVPWTPRARREFDADLSAINAERFGWSESSNLTLQLRPLRWLAGVSLGLEVRNVFDERTDLAATLDGYPNPVINTLYDDYGAYRTETGHPGGAYWNDKDGDGLPGWGAVRDPRLLVPPRAVRVSFVRDF